METQIFLEEDSFNEAIVMDSEEVDAMVEILIDEFTINSVASLATLKIALCRLLLLSI